MSIKAENIMQDIKVTRCSHCPMLIEAGDNKYGCKKGAFGYLYSVYLLEIHHNCPIKGETITFKIGENETN